VGVGSGGSVAVTSGVPVGTGGPPALACLTPSASGRTKNTTSSTVAKTSTPAAHTMMSLVRRFKRDSCRMKLRNLLPRCSLGLVLGVRIAFLPVIRQMDILMSINITN
jgi:hypothetical protein